MISIVDKNIFRSGIALATLSFGVLANAVTLGTFDNTTVTVGGFVKFDATASTYSDGEMTNFLGRDFYIPSLTPIGGEDQGMQIDFHARQSRFNFGTSTEMEGHTLKTFIEMDFEGTAGGDERISNSYSPRLRHAFISYDKWMFGQTWTTFQNLTALPETADFIGNTDFGIFVRQAQIRFTSGPWQFAIENPETTLTPFGGGARIVTDDNGTPDFVARYNLNTGPLSLSMAVLLRQLAYDNGSTIDTTTASTGFSVSGKVMIGEDDIRFGVNSGAGMGRYIGLNVVNGGVLDANGDIETIDSTAYYVAYRHLWNSQWRSNFTYSTIDIDNDVALTTTGATAKTSSARVNVFYSPVKTMSFGFEVAFAEREIETGASGDMNRFQFTAKLGF